MIYKNRQFRYGEGMNLKILYEDNHVIAVNKDPGTLSQGDRSGEPSLVEIVKGYIKKKYDKPGEVFLGPLHRLDKPVSGVMLFARTSKAAKRLHAEFKNSTVKKFYLAVVDDGGSRAVEQAVWHDLSQFMKRENDRSLICGAGEDGAMPVLLRYRPVVSGSGFALFLVRLITGKKHQIRAQLASLGHPVSGDRKYGSRSEGPEGSISLHAFSISIIHPVKKTPLTVSAGIPDRFRDKIDITETVIGEIHSMISEA